MILLSVQEAHDCSACVMIDGEIAAAAQEERWTGRKGDYGFPKNAVKFCLDFANVKPSELDKVLLCSHNWNPVLTKIKRNANFSVQDFIDEQHKYWYPTLFKDGVKVNYYNLFSKREDFAYDDFYPMTHLLSGYMDKEEMKEMQSIRKTSVAEYLGIPEDKVEFVRHEDCHTAYAYFGSHINDYEGRKRDCIALTCEGIGDYSNATYSYYLDDERIEVSSTKDCHLGHIYQYSTLLLGMKPNQHEYKVMGLAPYSNEYEKDKSWEVFKDVMKIDDILCIPVMNKRPKDLYFHFKEALEGHRFDGIAAAVQALTEYIGSLWICCIGERVEKSNLAKIRKLVFSGGVAQNIKMNKVMVEDCCNRFPFLTDFSVLPAAGDVSLPIGACYHWNHKMGNKNKSIKDFYLGPSINTEKIEKNYIQQRVHGTSTFKYLYRKYEKNKLHNKYVNWKDKIVWNEEDAAKLLSEGKIIARCSGRMEFGHRALGNRSILADPRKHSTVKKINDAIKFRCYDEKTEILTNGGWKFIKDISNNELVATLNPDTDELIFQPIVEKIESEYDGDLIQIKNKRIDLLVTPNHNLWIKKERSNKWLFKEASNIYGIKSFHYQRKGGMSWSGIHRNYFMLTSTSNNGFDININMDLWLEFMGYWLSEGYTCKYKSHYIVGVVQYRKSKYFDSIKKCIEKMPFNFKHCEKTNTFKVNNKQLYTYLYKFGKAKDKYIPKDLMGLHADQLKLLFDSLMRGDGNIRGKQFRYSTISKKLADDTQELSLRLGYSSVISVCKREGMIFKDGSKRRDLYQVRIGLSPISTVRHMQIDSVEYKGKVYCVSVPKYHILIVRRNGKHVCSGNSFWMPFACTILREYKDDYVKKNYYTKVEDRFMTIAFDTTDKGRKDLVAAIHPADHTCRPQILDRKDNKQYYDIIKSFGDITGCFALLNTSMNIHGEPIVRGAEDALRVFEYSAIDALILGDYLLMKKEE